MRRDYGWSPPVAGAAQSFGRSRAPKSFAAASHYASEERHPAILNGRLVFEAFKLFPASIFIATLRFLPYSVFSRQTTAIETRSVRRTSYNAVATQTPA
jgi:hypothetical protein